tara:strand:+ start:458 stop:1033 length:576 start_codon:yes stop_codon:yes gene_type:complete
MAFNIAILISGNGSNMLKIIQAYKNGQIKSKVVTVVSNNPNTIGIKKAQSYGIITKVINHREFNNTIQFEKTLSEYLFKKSINLICLAGFMRVLGKNFITKWDRKIINIHPSLLPSFKGLNTHKRAIEQGVKYSGCTVHYVNESLDSGEIIDQDIVRVSESDSEISLKKKILMKEHKLYIKVIQKLEKNCD